MPCSSCGSSPVLSSDTCYSLEARAWSRESRAQQGGAHSQSSPVTTRMLCCGFALLAAVGLLRRSWQLVEIPGHLPKAAVTYPCAAPRVGAPVPCITQAMPWRSRDLHWHPCVLQGTCEEHTSLHPCYQGVQALPTSQKVPYQRLELHPVVLLSPALQELLPSLWLPRFRCCSSARHPGGGCGASISQSTDPALPQGDRELK